MTDRTVVYRLRAEAGNLPATMKMVSTSVTDAANKMTAATAEGEKWRRGMDTLGDTAGKVGLVAAGGLAAGIKAAMDWESAWAGVTKTVDGSAAEMAVLEEGLRGLATTLPATHEEIAGVAEAAGQLGVGREDILDFTKTMIDLGETTNLTAEEAATSIAQISNVMGTTGDEVDNFGAALVALGNDGASTEKQILEMTQRIAGAGAQIGLAETDILSIANAAASMGIEAEAGGSAISRVFTELAKATKSGNDNLAVFAETAGMSSEQFVQAFEDDPAQAFAAFTKGLDGVTKSGGDVFSLLKDLGMSDVRVSQALLSMAASGDLLTDSLDLGAKAWEDNTALAAEAEKRYATSSAKMQIAWNEIKDAGIEAGAALLPVVSEVAGVVGNLANAFGNLPGPVKTAATGMAGVTAVLGGGLWFSAKAIGGVANMRGALSDLGVSADGTKSRLGKVTDVLGGPWGIALGGATIAIGLLMNEQGKAKGYVDSLTAALEDQTGAMTRQTIATNLQEEDWLGYAQSIGIGADTVVDAVLGSADAMEQLKAAAKADDSFFDLTGDSDQFIANVEAQARAQKEAEKNARLLADANGETGDSADAAAGPVASLAETFQTAATEAEEFGDVVDALNEQLSGRADVRSYQAAIDDFTKSLKDNGKTFDVNTEKGRNNQAALDNIAGSALKVAENMGRAERQKFLTSAIEDIRTMGNQMGLPKSEINALIALLQKANKADVKPKIDADPAALQKKVEDAKDRLDKLNAMKPSPKVDAQTAAAEAKLNNLLAMLREAERDRSSTVTTVFRQIGKTTMGPQERADGGFIAGPGTATSDSIPAYLSNGEYVIKAAAVDKYGVHMFDRLNAMHFAKGGSADKDKKKRGPKHHGEQTEWDGGPSAEALEIAAMQAAEAAELYYAEQERAQRHAEELADEAAEHAARVNEEMLEAQREAEERQREHDAAVLEGQERAWDQATDAAQAQKDAAQEMVDSVQQNMDRIGEAATSAFSGSWFTGEQQTGMWAGGSGTGDWRSQAEADISGLTERGSIISQLAGLGLTGAALEDLLGNQSNAGIQAMIGAGEIDDFAALFAQREALMASVGAQAGQAGYGADMASANAQLVQMNAQFAALTAAIEAARPITVLEAVSAQATAQEFVRIMAMAGAS